MWENISRGQGLEREKTAKVMCNLMVLHGFIPERVKNGQKKKEGELGEREPEKEPESLLDRG